MCYKVSILNNPLLDMSLPNALAQWLDTLCRMIPGVSHAVVLSSDASAQQLALWPANAQVDDLLLTAAQQSSLSQDIYTQSLRRDQIDKGFDRIIALPLELRSGDRVILSIALKLDADKQPVVMQLIGWGQQWLKLLPVETLARSPVDQVDKPEQTISGLFYRPGVILFVALLCIILVMFVVKTTYRVTAPANLEGRIQRVVVAPFDGFIASAHKRAGELVSEGDLLAELDTREWLLEQQQQSAQRSEYSRQYRQALARRDMAQAAIFKSQMQQVDAQLRLIEKKIQRSSLLAPLDGVIISGDLDRSQGAPVKLGDTLYELAPLDEYRLIVLVNERQVADIKAGQQGELTLKAKSSETLGFTVNRISPVFEEQSDSIAFRVEAQLDSEPSFLRPGMQGQAKIAVDERSLAWIYFHRPYDALRTWLWTWLN